MWNLFLLPPFFPCLHYVGSALLLGPFANVNLYPAMSTRIIGIHSTTSSSTTNEMASRKRRLDETFLVGCIGILCFSLFSLYIFEFACPCAQGRPLGDGYVWDFHPFQCPQFSEIIESYTPLGVKVLDMDNRHKLVVIPRGTMCVHRVQGRFLFFVSPTP